MTDAPRCVEPAERINPRLAILSPGSGMRAEAQSLVEQIKQSVGLLRRHL
jgi:hypothetical protein